VSRFRFIAAEKASSPVVRLCRVLGVSSSGFYAWQHRQPSQRQRTDSQLMDHIRSVHANSHCALRTGWPLSEALSSHDHPFGYTGGSATRFGAA
jgi:hypothetical protein